MPNIKETYDVIVVGRDTQDARQLLQVPDLDLKQLYLLSVLRALQ